MGKLVNSIFVLLIVALVCFVLGGSGLTYRSKAIVSVEESDRISVEELDAFNEDESFENVKVVGGGKRKIITESGTRIITAEIVGIQADNKQYLTYIEKENGETEYSEYYFDILNDLYYAKSDGVWHRQIWEPWMAGRRDVYELIAYFPKSYFEKSEYSISDKGYVYETVFGPFEFKYVYKFKNGKMVSYYEDYYFYTDDSREYYELTTYDYVYTYGGQSVTTPDDLPAND